VVWLWVPSSNSLVLSGSSSTDSPNLESQVPVFISPGNVVTQLYSGTLSSLFLLVRLAGYGGQILTHLHTGFPFVFTIYPHVRPHRKHRLQRVFYYFLRIRCHNSCLFEPLSDMGRGFFLSFQSLQLPCRIHTHRLVNVVT
jgi:hypothetical protein